ncbi:MAG: Do family serine endopeptidase [Bacteroidaceae bacterium]|nr:Do family serine endopeptidase [Bacteroidaceae bacterium]
MKKSNIFSLVAIIIAALSLTLNFTNTCAANSANTPGSAVPANAVDLTYAAEKALPSVVYIHFLQNSKIQTVEVENDPFSDFFDPFGGFFGRGQGGGGKQKRQIQTPKKEGAGSGVIISEDGYIVTNNHVVAGADELTVTMNDNKEYSAKIIGTDETTDLALIKINAKNLPAIKIANSEDLKVGQWVLAVGNPLGLNNTVTAGIVSAKARSLGANGVESFIQTDAAINAGNSGGALVNTNGDLVGINAMLYSQTGSYSGYGFAIPTTIMNKVVADLKEYGTVQRAMIGITGSDVNKYYDLMKSQGKEVEVATMEGIHVEEVIDGGAAAQAGVEKDDIITKVDDKPVKKMSELQEAIARKRPGDKITLTFIHNKKTITKEVTLKNAQGNTKVVKKAELDILGANFRPINTQEKEQLELSYGLKVTKVENGPMKSAGVPAGFIILGANDSKITSEEDLQKAVKSASTNKEDPVLYLKGIFPSGKRGYFAVSLEQ